MKKSKYILALIMICCLGTYAQSVPVKKAETKDMTLEMHRKKIDSLDQTLIKVLGERERIVKEIGIYKAKNNIPALQASRFQQVLDRAIAAGKKEGLSEEFVTEFLNALHKESLRIEEALIQK
ncbi:Chorismate mutase [Pedobacter westerhofensis]|uniref:chorismate mutase n=1 Tax=Pedobacter westerhofensis TaxID=425512 RepID=A0A521FIU2_9SPHI|nr:chorismate mutase [Pedobacter westerhofensis]SMO95490.1 Chorismate mutase [Pedobacter westerhofensis]